MFSFGYKEVHRDLRQGCRLNNVKKRNVKWEIHWFLREQSSVPVSAHVSTEDWLVNHSCGFSTAGMFGITKDEGWWAAKHTTSLCQQPVRERSLINV